MGIASFVLLVIKCMEQKIIIKIFDKYAWIISKMSDISLKITFMKNSKNILIERNKMVNGEMTLN